MRVSFRKFYPQEGEREQLEGGVHTLPVAF